MKKDQEEQRKMQGGQKVNLAVAMKSKTSRSIHDKAKGSKTAGGAQS